MPFRAFHFSHLGYSTVTTQKEERRRNHRTPPALRASNQCSAVTGESSEMTVVPFSFLFFCCSPGKSGSRHSHSSSSSSSSSSLSLSLSGQTCPAKTEGRRRGKATPYFIAASTVNGPLILTPFFRPSLSLPVALEQSPKQISPRPTEGEDIRAPYISANTSSSFHYGRKKKLANKYPLLPSLKSDAYAAVGRRRPPHILPIVSASYLQVVFSPPSPFSFSSTKSPAGH